MDFLKSSALLILLMVAIATRADAFGPQVREYLDGVEVILCDFSAAAGDTVEVRHYPSGDSSTVIVNLVANRNYFGRTRFTQEYVEVFTPTLSNVWTVVDGLGKLENQRYTFPYELVRLNGAIIRGVSIGTLGVELHENGIPERTTLQQNYPNPFNPSTKIEFALPTSGHAKLVVYDVLGREVATLVNEHLLAGNHEATFATEGLTSGVYFYVLQVAGTTITRKMLLMK